VDNETNGRNSNAAGESHVLSNAKNSPDSPCPDHLFQAAFPNILLQS
jgi:hypothetical protein